MKKYRITVPVTRASGWQTYTVKAESITEALIAHQNGDSDFEDEELEVTNLGEPEVEELE
jgi:hypothetical protein